MSGVVYFFWENKYGITHAVVIPRSEIRGAAFGNRSERMSMIVTLTNAPNDLLVVPIDPPLRDNANRLSELASKWHADLFSSIDTDVTWRYKLATDWVRTEERPR